MAVFAAPTSLPICHLNRNSSSLVAVRSPVALRWPAATDQRRRCPVSIRCSSAAASAAPGNVTPAIQLTDKALSHLNKLRAERNEDLCLRIGVKQGGCSGMSYTMDFMNKAHTRPDDSIIEYSGFLIACDPKSLLFLYGMQLDFSDALIGGGFSFKNPNATQTCGCGKSFAAEL